MSQPHADVPPDVVVRAFRRSDREQLTALVNAHAQAVVPGVVLPVNTVLAQLEGEPGEFIVDPWVEQRTTLVAEQRDRVVAAAHLLRYGTGPAVGAGYRGLGELRWLLCWPDQSFWPGASAAADALAAAAVRALRAVGASRISADGTLPAPGVYGVPDAWPHVHAVLARAGFVPGDRTEVVLLADVAHLPRPPAPLPGLHVVRTLGVNGTRLTARLDGADVGLVEVDVLADAGRRPGQQGWADVGNLSVVEGHRRQGVATWLLGCAAEWLRLGHVDRLLAYAVLGDPGEEAERALYRSTGFAELTRTRRSWDLPLG